MTDQELRDAGTLQNRHKGSEEYSMFLSRHEPDVARLLTKVERLRKALHKIKKTIEDGVSWEIDSCYCIAHATLVEQK
ncbi:hypothetical protein [Aneurinibacillus aneurinilyticus]|uniref:Uncharacterized protein n=2 Tax=Aneurinibacillus aneurinilyticus TaxID=1391 RepID=A0A848D3Z3_ANEAE|nr:hypothetical protein [Aneurinibacillus aneurinilyticus]NMF01520.1 hypothetical protein [Aneurinibacillus aneurinilyticus]